MSLTPGTSLEHYTLVEQIGEGGMGQVWRATDTTLGRDVALKLIPAAFAADPERMLRFQREAKVLAGLNHPNIASIYGFHETTVDGAPVRFLVMELVPGPDLSERLARGALPRGEAVAVCRQLCDALEYAHERNIIHRDLKPANIKVTPDGAVKVLDFGLAKAVEPELAGGQPTSTPTMLPTVTSGGTQKGVILGTAAYMSPEQARGKTLDRRTDIWAFGTVLYELLTGRRAFDGETITDVLAAVVTREPDLDALPGGTGRRIRTLLERCLEKDPKRRLRDIGEARITLENLEDDARSTVRRAVPDAAAAPAPRSRLPLAAGWIVAALAIGALTWTVLNRSPGPTAGEAPLRKWTITLPASGGAAEADPAISRDGRWLVYVGEGGLALRDLTALDARPIEGTEGAIDPFWSPDGQWIGFFRDQALWKIPREGGRSTLIAEIPVAGGAESAVWTEAGRIFAGTGSIGLLEVSAQGGSIEEVLRPEPGETDFHEVAAVPGDRGVLFVLHREDGIDTIALRLPDGSRRPVVRLDNTVSHPALSPTGHILFHKEGPGEGIWAVPFSPDRLETTGEPFPVGPRGNHPTVSGDGTLVYEDTPDRPPARITWYDRSGSAVRVIDEPVETTRPFPDLSPDGSRLLLPQTFGDARELYLYDVERRSGRRLTFLDQRIDLPIWHPDGRAMAFYESSFDTYVLDTAAGEPRRLTAGIMAGFTPDGGTIVLARLKPQRWDWDIVRQSPPGDESSLDTLVATDGVDWFPTVSPDGNLMAYSSDVTGREEVFLTRYPGCEQRWQISGEGGMAPRWTRGGREIVYTTRTHIWSVAIDTSQGIEIGIPRKLFARPSTDWSSLWFDGFAVTADGEEFVMLDPVERDGPAEPVLVVVENWIREFEKGSD